jgi:hypothetical protein
MRFVIALLIACLIIAGCLLLFKFNIGFDSGSTLKIASKIMDIKEKSESNIRSVSNKIRRIKKTNNKIEDDNKNNVGVENLNKENQKENIVKNNENYYRSVDKILTILNQIQQYDVVRFVKINDYKNKYNREDIINFIVDYFVVVSSNDFIKNNDIQSILVIPAMNYETYLRSIQKDLFIKVILTNGDTAYIMPYSIHSVPKLAILELYSRLKEEDIYIIKDKIKSQF